MAAGDGPPLGETLGQDEVRGVEATGELSLSRVGGLLAGLADEARSMCDLGLSLGSALVLHELSSFGNRVPK